MSAPPQVPSQLSRDEKLALLARLAQTRVAAKAAKAAEEGPLSYPLAFAQLRFWFLDQLDPGSYVDNIFRALRFAGPLNQAALERALDELARRHGALRTHFPAEGGEPLQVVESWVAGVEPWLRRVDLSALGDETALAQAVALAEEEARRPFDLARGPLFRARLLRLGAEDHALLICLHHIVGDGWSLGLLLRDLSALYGACAAGEPSPLPEPKARFGDFARWQRERLKGEALSQELAFWRQRLEGAPAVLELPTDHPRRHAASPRGDVIGFEIAGSAAAGLKELALAAGATPFISFLTLFDLLLFRSTGQSDFVVGIPAANRQRTELEGVVGCFASTLLVRARIDAKASFRSLLGAVRAESLAVFAHSDLPFEKLVEELQPERNLSHNPLFQVMFALQGGAGGAGGKGGAFSLPGLTATSLPVDRGLAKLDLTLDMVETEGGFGGYFEYSTDLFEAATIHRLAGHFRALLASALAQPEGTVGELRMLSEEERNQILVDWNQRADNPPALILDRIVEQARRTPDAPAVLFGDLQLSHGELHRQANRLARYLRRLGVGAEMSVGLCVERSLEMPLLLLAVLKAGGAWVPLDPEYPKERLALMIEDTAMPVLLTQAHLADRLPATIGHALVEVDRLDLSAEDDSEPDWEIHPESLAYIVYTSGSTGRPKGVAVPHRSWANHVNACALAYRMGPRDRTLQFTSISFDITSEEIFPTWLMGGAVVPRPPGLFPSFDELQAMIVRYEITAMDLPTAYWHEWVSEMYRTKMPPPEPLRLVVIGTEQAFPERVAEWLELCADRVKLNNSYASTEATVTAVVYEPSVADLPRYRGGDRVPVGKTIANCCAYVLDVDLEPVPVGVSGDVYIAGPNVSRGYANWPDRTAASFIPDPFSASMGYGPGQRMYRQGDIGRWLPTGDLEYLGRRDDQVKIRGFRVEPDEVATVLARHPAVKDCTVLVKSDGPKGKRLVGYLTLIPGAATTLRELRGYLRESLPEHMVPSGLVILDLLPLTSNGRVDARALPEPTDDRPELESVYVAPRTVTEGMLEGIWCEVLGATQVGVHDNFFELGGHSLLGTQVVSRARERFRIELPLRALFENPTLAELARKIEEVRSTAPAAGSAPSRIEPAPRDRPLQLSFSQHRLWFLDRLEPGTPLYNIPLSLHLQGELRVSALAAALAGVAHRHEALRTTFAEEGGRPFQVVREPGPSALPVVDLAGIELDLRSREARRLVTAEARLPFSLGAGPLVRWLLLRLEGEEHVLSVTMHHIVSDGWSLPIFVREMDALYRERIGGPAAALAPLPIQYADFAAWQRGWLQGEALAAELAHWRGRLQGLPPLLALPTDRPRPAVRTGRGGMTRTALGGQLSEGLARASRTLGATPFMTVLAAYAALLHRYSNQESFAVGVPVAGRNRMEIEGLIGFFVNTLVLRCDVASEEELRGLVSRVRDTVLDADAHQDVPFEKLVEELQPERSLGHTPLFQVALAFQNLPKAEFASAGLRVTPVGVTSGTSKFDLTLTVQTDSEELVLYLEHSTELFDEATIDRFAAHFARLLGGAVETPERRVRDLPLLAPAEREQLLAEWNPRPVEGGPEERGRATLQRRFEEQVERNPERPAVSCAGETLTYRELDARANRLAHHLLAAGVRPGDLVGLCFDRSLDLVVALLATLKAGGGYLPLDPTCPAERLAFTLEDSGVGVVLTREADAATLPEREGLRRIAVDGEAAAIAARSSESFGVAGDPDLPAYVIYTSGSTGRPKGVVVPHGHATRLLSATAHWFGFGPDDVWTLFHSYAFDFSVWEIWGALLYGGRLVVVPYWESRSPEAFYELLRSERVTVLNQTPSAFRQLQWAEDAVLQGGVPDLALRTVIFGGEALDLPGLRPWFERHGDERPLLVNMYGITETTVHVTYRPIRLADLESGRGSVIGAPIPDLSVHVVDRDLELQPIGVPGEMVVGGEGVAQGYLGRPELTAERFVPDPFGSPGARLYRSGDLARRLADGDLEYLGRIDFQVKIRGFRIELGEIEAALSRHPAVSQVAVLVREDTPGGQQLVAYFVPVEGASVNVTDLRAALQKELPDYMVPAAFVVLETLPLTANGKVDRRALPAPEGDRALLGNDFVAPEGAVQEKVAEIWAEVLRLERVGAGDNFFALGGHSLLATQVLSRLREAFRVELPLRVLFESPTVAGVAEAIIQRELERADDDLLAQLLSELESEPA